MNERGRHVGGILLRSCVSGLLLGVAARAVMRLIALEAAMSYGFTIGGSLEVVALGTIVGTPVAVAFFAFRPHAPLGRPWLGALCGALVFAILLAVPPPAARSALAATYTRRHGAGVRTALRGLGLALELLGGPVRRHDASPKP